MLDFLNIFRPYAWWQLLTEWLLIGAVVYWVVRFLRGTRGVRLLKGIALVLIFLYLIVKLVAGSLHLDSIAYLYDKFVQYTAFAVLIVFQPELRRAIMRLGETRLFRSFSSQMNEEIEAIVQAAMYLSKRKIGVLMAIERSTGLGGIAETGTRLNSDLSSKLLCTIFYPNSPLHDLGVIISQGRVAYAGVEFPMAEEGVVERELGSRHRAAVGLSSESDAVVVVVSEQTGDVSIAERGVLMKKLTSDALRGMLAELLGGADAKVFGSDQSPLSAAELPERPKAESELVEK